MHDNIFILFKFSTTKQKALHISIHEIPFILYFILFFHKNWTRLIFLYHLSELREIYFSVFFSSSFSSKVIETKITSFSFLPLVLWKWTWIIGRYLPECCLQSILCLEKWCSYWGSNSHLGSLGGSSQWRIRGNIWRSPCIDE